MRISFKYGVMLGAALLTGCSASPSVDAPWGSGQTAEVADATVSLTSNLWINAMPSADAESDQALNGALYIESKHELPASLDVVSVALRQGDKQWLVSAQDFELRSHSDQRWEVAFAVGANIDEQVKVDVALQLASGELQTWLIERGVEVDTTY